MKKLVLETKKHKLIIEPSSKDFEGWLNYTITDLKDNKICGGMVAEEHNNDRTVEELEEFIRTTVEDTEKWNAWRKAINEQEWHRNTFDIDGMYVVEGIHKPLETWNGWQCPYLTKESWDEVLDSQDIVYYYPRFDEETKDMYIRSVSNCECGADETCEWCEEERLEKVEFEGEFYYHLSGWIWDIHEEDSEDIE